MEPMDAYGYIDDELGAVLAAQAAAEGYRTLRVLKESELETTELVAPPEVGPSSADEAGLYVRKRIRLQDGAGPAYEVLFAAQRAGAPLPHTPRIEACARLGDELTVVMEHVSGQTLGEYVAAHGAGPDRARELMPLLCEAVSELHERLDPPLIHRDLKPSNIIISDGGGGRPSGMPAIIDFGIARTWRDGAEADTVHLGTRGYAAPEQFGFGQTDVRSDVYALGMLLYFCCTGEQPKAGLDAPALAAAGVPAELATVILRATAFDPAARYQSAAGLKAAFEGAVAPQVDAGIQAFDAGQGLAAASASGPLQRLSNGVGRVWNAIVGIIWSFFMVILAMCVGDSLVGNTEYPLWYAICLYGGFGGTGFSAAAWFLLDKRRLRERYFKAWGFSRKHEWLAFAILAAVSALFFLVLLFAEVLRDALLL